ncbi:MAG: hypothetical protein IPL78_18930 [Chloroflexi bacterium]|nr:hypothetical protein [Chloroflexota bacterium]
MLEDNQNPDCLLPCWWGATPGQTYWQDIEPFLNSLAKTIHYSSSGTSFGTEVILPLPQSVVPFQLIVVYQQQGISFRYYVDASTNGETVTACFKPGIETERPDLFPAGPRIYVWEPGQHKEIEEISPVPGETYFPLEAKTDLTLQTLYEKFTDPDEQPCIDTPVDAWR